MSVTDPVADAMTKIRNASGAHHKSVDLKPSKVTNSILDVLKEEGYIQTYKQVGEDVPLKRTRVYLKYVNRVPVIQQIERVSKPGIRIYRGAKKLPRVRRGLGCAIVSTSKGVMSDRKAFKEGVGGEVLCYVW